MWSLRYWAARLLARAAKRTRALCSALLVTALALAGLAVAGAPAAGAAASARARPAAVPDEPTASQDDLRTGWDPNEPALTPAVVNGGTFGQVFKRAVKGQVYAQPLVVGSTVIVATEEDWVYGLNATTGAVEWSTQLGTPYHITNCGDLVPDIGVTGTPVYDSSTGTVYVMALVKQQNIEWHLFGLNVTNGAITLKQRIAGSPSNDSHISFDAVQQDQRTGLLLMNGWVYAGFASHCDRKPYAGFVAAVDVAQRPVTTTLWTDEAGVSDDQAGIWQGGGGLMSDGTGRIFFTSGNGISPPKGPGNQPPGQLAESVVRLAVDPANGTLSPQDFFSPGNAPKLDASDIDFGAGGPVGLPFGTNTYPDILVQAGKFGTIYLLDRNNLGGREQAPGDGDADLAMAGPYAGQWGHPAVFDDTPVLTAANASSANDYMVYVGKDDYMREFKFGDDSSDAPTLTDYANSTFTLGYTSGSPVITSNGTDPSSAIIWAVNSSGKTGTNSSLGAWDLLPQPKAGGGTKLREIWSGSIGTAAKFTIAATDNGMVYVGTRDGDVYGFGVSGGAAVKRSGTIGYPDTPVGSSASGSATLTATRTVTVSGVRVSTVHSPDPYTVGRVTVTRHGSTVPARFPVTLHKGDALHAQVKFAPAVAGGVPGQVTFATSAGSPGSAAVPLIGDGTGSGLAATPRSLQFVLTSSGQSVSNVPVGIGVPLTTTIVNTSAVPEKVTSVSAPAGPYSYIGLPRPGTIIRPGQSLVVEVTFGPNRPGPSSGVITIRASHGPGIRVRLSGTGLAGVTRFTTSPGVVHFGRVRVGHTATVMIHVVNAGNQPSLMRRTAAPGGPFGAPLRVANGLPVNPSDDLVLPVSFHPTKAGAFTGSYPLRWTDRFGTHTIDVPITGTGVR